MPSRSPLKSAVPPDFKVTIDHIMTEVPMYEELTTDTSCEVFVSAARPGKSVRGTVPSVHADGNYRKVLLAPALLLTRRQQRISNL